MSDTADVPGLGAPGATAATSDEPLIRETACIRCSYSLWGLRPSGICPECGTRVEESLRGFLLRYASPEYIQQLRKGLTLILNGILLLVALKIVIVMVLREPVLHVGPVLGPIWWVNFVMLIPSAMILLGYWKYTEPDPGFVGQEDPHAARKVLRASVVGNATVTTAYAVLAYWGLDTDFVGALRMGAAINMTGILAVVLAVVAYVVWTAQFLAAMKYTRWVASRLPDRWIQKRAKTYMWLLPSLLVVAAVLRVGLAMAVTLVVALMLYWNLLDRMRMQVRAIQARMPQRGHATKQA